MKILAVGALLALSTLPLVVQERRPVEVAVSGDSIDLFRLQRRWPRSNDTVTLELRRTGAAQSSGGWPTWPVRGEHEGRLAAGEFEELARL